MTKGQTRLLAEWSTKHLYYEMDADYLYGHGKNKKEMKNNGVSWKDIESKVGTTFSDSDRQEIYECTNKYSHEKSRLEAGAPVKDVKALCTALIKHSKAICEIAERFRPIDSSHANEIDRVVLDALTIQHSNRDFYLRDELHKLANAAQRIVSGLSRKPLPLVKTSRTSEVVALEAFITGVLLDAETKPARREPGYKKPEFATAKEFERWGIPIGPKSAKFRTFTNILLKGNYTPDQISEAFRGARAEGALSYSEIFDRADRKRD